MNQLAQHHVIVIGAGIAGLAAAWKLQNAGIQVLVLEAEHTVGGRMKSILVDDALIDCGAQFLSSAYTIIPKLIRETGSSDNLVKTSQWIGIVRKNDIVLLHTQKPWRLLSSHILSICNFLRLLINQFRLKNKSRSLNDVTSWSDYDKSLASEWVIENFGETVAHELTASILNGLYFQSLSNSSAILTAVITAFAAHLPYTTTLSTGMGNLAQTMADKLDVKLNVSVSTIRETLSGVDIETNIGSFKAENVILTVPAPIAKNILQNPDAETALLLEATYSSTATISLLTNNDWTPPAMISSVYGLVFNPTWNSKIAALTIENNKHPSRKKQGFLINIMISDEHAKKILSFSDEEIYASIKSDINKILPGIDQHLQTKYICRWPLAMPHIPIGHAHRVKQYRESRDIMNRIWLAGDYLGFPWTDSAAETGVWAANQVSSKFQHK